LFLCEGNGDDFPKAVHDYVDVYVDLDDYENAFDLRKTGAGKGPGPMQMLA
jgi:hypothetical protein